MSDPQFDGMLKITFVFKSGTVLSTHIAPKTKADVIRAFREGYGTYNGIHMLQDGVTTNFTLDLDEVAGVF